MDDSFNPLESGFASFRIGFPNYKRSIFMNKTEIVTDKNGTIIGVTNPSKLLWAKIPPTDGILQILEVGDSAFKDCRRLREISFSDNLEIIGDDAFKNATRLTLINLPDTLYHIGKGAFSNTALISFTFPKGVREVSNKLFMDCKEIENINLHEKIEKIGILSFSGTDKLLEIKIPNGVSEISQGAFMQSGIRRIYLPHSIKRIGEASFSSTARLQSIYYDGRRSDFSNISFGLNWNRGMREDVSLFLKDERGEWYDAFNSKKREEDRTKEYLKLFGLESLPSLEELKRLYRKKTLSFHPDRISSLNLDDEFIDFANKKFNEYREAYEALRFLCK